MISLKFPCFFLILAAIFFTPLNSTAQKILNESETQWVLQAQTDLEEAYSNPSLSEKERLARIDKAAKTLKEYGQAPMYLPENSNLRHLMQSNYQLKLDETKSVNNLIAELNRGLLKNKMKFINNLQIDVTSEQIKFLIPGSTPIDLSSDVVSSMFQWNATDGFNGGQRATAKGIKNKFLELAKEKGKIDENEFIKQYKMHSLRKLDKDLKSLDDLEEKMRKAYDRAEGSLRTMRGYEGAKLYEGNQKKLDPRLRGTWKFTAPGFIVLHQYGGDGQCQIRVNGKQNDFQYETVGSFINYTDRKGKKTKLGYTIEGNLLYYGTKRSSKKAGHPLSKSF